MHASKFAKLWLAMDHDYHMHMEIQLAPQLTEVQLRALELIVELERVKPSDLIQYLNISPAAITTLVDRMEKNELLLRERDEFDRRIVWLRLTDKGSREYDRGIGIREQYFSERLSELSQHNQQVMTYLLGKIAPRE